MQQDTGIDWQRVQQTKRDDLQTAAGHAMEQQKRDRKLTVAISFPDEIADGRQMRVTEKAPDALRIVMTDVLNPEGEALTDTVRFRLDEPVDMLSAGSGLAVIVETDAGASPEVRLGVRLIAAGGEKAATILPYIPVRNAWGDNPHEIYFDWAFINYADVGEAIDVLKSVETIEFLAGARVRAPDRGPSRTPRSAEVRVSDLRLVDYLQGSYDPARHRWTPDAEPDLTLQHRCQEVTGVVASFGGEEGIRSAVESLDLCAHTQCWDGSFLDGRRGARTVTSGEYTYGFTVYGTLTGYLALEDDEAPQLDEDITVGPCTMPRREVYRRMFYRAAMSRAGIALPPDYRDDIIGTNTLITGANRVLGYAIAMHMVADALGDEGQKRAVMEKYDGLMDAIAAAQGEFSGGFPLLAEGNRFDGAGIHYDNGYIRTHMDWLILGAHRTGDPRFIHILRRYQEVFEAVMDAEGTGLLPLLSERHARTNSVRLIVPDSTFQVGAAHGLPIIAQWGYNCSRLAWANPDDARLNFWTSANRMRGYPLGAFVGRLLDDMARKPEPVDVGYLFPRQFPIWSSRFYTKDGKLVRTSQVYVHPDGTMENDFRVEIGQYLETVGAPVQVDSPEGTVIAQACELCGWPRLLPEDAVFTVAAGGEKIEGVKADCPQVLSLSGETRVTVNGPETTLPAVAGGETVPFRAVFTLKPVEPGRRLSVTIRILRETAPYEHRFLHEQGG